MRRKDVLLNMELDWLGLIALSSPILPYFILLQNNSTIIATWRFGSAAFRESEGKQMRSSLLFYLLEGDGGGKTGIFA